MFDFDAWLAPIGGDGSAGRELREDKLFPELERLMQPSVEMSLDERNAPSGQTVIPVAWTEVLSKAEEMRGAVRDLRLLVIVARALANTRGFDGLADGLSLIARTFEAHWDSMHPALRSAATPRDAALRRINALREIENATDGLLGDLRAMTLLSPRGVGPLTGRDVERGSLDARTVIAEMSVALGAAEEGRIAAEHDTLIKRVRAGCAAEKARDAEAYAGLVAGARAAQAALADVERALGARVGRDAGATLPALARLLARVLATLERAQAPAAGSPDATPAAESAGAAAEARAGAASATGALPGRLDSRDDVVKCLDLIIAFYDRTEPSSPIPHLARRIRRMVPMDFLELMEDLAPSGLKEFRVLAGVADKAKPSAKEER